MSTGFLSSFPLLRAQARIGCWLGHLPSRVLLGRLYESGRVPGRDIDDANREYLQAAEAGDLNGMWHFGVNHLASKDGATDHQLALKWLQRAADGGHAMAGWALGKLYLAGKLVQQDAQRGLKLLEASAAQQCPQAVEALIEIYRDGKYGVPADEERLAHWVSRGG